MYCSYCNVVVSSVKGRCLLIVTYSGMFSLLALAMSNVLGESTDTYDSGRSNSAFLKGINI